MGRGYVKDGHLKAANFLVEKFNEINLAPLNNDRFTQDFNINVNTFPDSVELKIDGKLLVPGKDFMISWFKKFIN